jgi:hypothetical protein
MKIICTLEEYSRMVRMCQRGAENDCKGCVMENICGNNIIEDAVQFEIESTTLERSE